jgi:hypothetical protein
VASPYPTGTFTLLDTPSFSWRDSEPSSPARRFLARPVERRVMFLIF